MGAILSQLGGSAVPRDVLASLMDSVQKIQEEQAEDKAKITKLEEELKALQALEGTKGRVFTLFPKLPKEIRLMIWDVHLSVPQILAVRQIEQPWLMDEALSTDIDSEYILVPLNNNYHTLLRAVNHEARGQAEKVSRRKNWRWTDDLEIVPALFVNPDKDILWVPLAERVPTLWHSNLGRYFEEYDPGFEESKVPRLAIPFEGLYYQFDADAEDIVEWWIGLAKFAYLWGVHELTFVVTGAEVASSQDIVFVVPRDTIKKYVPDIMNKWVARFKGKEETFNHMSAWEDFEKNESALFEGVLEAYLEPPSNIDELEQKQSYQLTLDQKMIVAWNNHGWEPPVIRFREATTSAKLKGFIGV